MDAQKGRRSRHTIGLVLLCLAGGILAAAAFIYISFSNLLGHTRTEREALLAMTDAYVQAFAEDRGNDSAVPAAFRRKALDFFNDRADSQSGIARLTMNMPGMPGHEIGVKTSDPDVAETIAGFQSDPERLPVTDLFFTGDRLIDRTIHPSIAGSDSCTACHNAISNKTDWQVGDVMGAFVVESDLTGSALALALQGLVILALTGSGLFLIANRERERAGRTVSALQAEMQARDEQQAAERKAAFLSLNDPLTELPNRARLNQYAEDCIEENRVFSLLFIDLDGFKFVNDKYGHLAGDAMLVHVAKQIESISSRYQGLAARIGGDEFAVIMPGLTGAEVRKSAREISTALSRPFISEGAELRPRASIGVFDGGSDSRKMTGVTDYMRAADMALYAAKSGGRGAIVRYSEDIAADLRTRQEIEEAIPDAIANGEFKIHYQPQIDLKIGTIKGVEALVRWQRDGKLIRPDRFLPVAEESGRICAIDLYVLERALEQTMHWAGKFGVDLSISVNLSPLHFKSNAVVTSVSKALKTSGLPPHQLILEVTEGILIEDWAEVKSVLAKLHKLGVRLSMDDFGTGYSSLAYLRQLAFDEVKIDRSFLTDIERSEETRFILDGLVDIVQSLGRKLVAEGIETAAQKQIVEGLGIDIGQGYYFDKPLTERQVENRLRALKTPKEKRSA